MATNYLRTLCFNKVCLTILIIIGFCNAEHDINAIIYDFKTDNLTNGDISNHDFNMTQNLNKETKLLQLCILYNLNTSECTAIYGGIGNETSVINRSQY